MSRTRTIGLYALGTAMAALIGGASYWLIRRYQRKRARPKPEDGPTPSTRTEAEDPEPDDGVERSARGRYLRPRELQLPSSKLSASSSMTLGHPRTR